MMLRFRSRFFLHLLTIASLLWPLAGPARAARPSPAKAPANQTLIAFQRVTADSGWVLIGAHLYWTEDRGQTWRELPLPDFGAAVILAGTFADAEHGWLTAGEVSESGEPRYTLARTADGGQTWRTLPVNLFKRGDVSALAGAAYLQFLDARTGWLLIKRQTSSAFSVGALFKTRDGGATWIRLSIPLAGPFHFADEQHGWVEDKGVRAFTSDGGQTWTSPALDNPKGKVVGASATSPGADWVKSVSGECDERGCWQTTQLLQSDDGGRTWSPVTLPGAPDGLTRLVSINGVVTQDPNALTLTFDGQGFDSCTKPPVGDMQTWYTYSPYKVWNLYLGGVSLFGPCTGLTAAYVSQLAQQGWLFIPTWVGPQAACSSYLHRMSADPATAYVEGKIQADLALDVATQLGLTLPDQSGGIIYYDIEAYPGASQACRDTTKAFISGWVDQLHANGNQAGVYGGTCNSYLYDFALFQDPPDDIWMAYWTSSGYNPNASVFTMPSACASFYTGHWMNAQRIRQYAGDHSETWGSGAMTATINIDSDVISGTVAAALGNCSPTADQVALFVYAQNGGQCVVKGVGVYSDTTLIGLPNDSISAVRVGSNVTVTLYQHTVFTGTAETFIDDDNDLSDNPIGNDQVSSAIVQTRTAAAPQLVFLPLLGRTPPGYAVTIPNGDFESGRTAWAESSALTQSLIVTASVLPPGFTAHSGAWLAWLGNLNDETASIQQTVTISAEAPYLAYWHWIYSDETEADCFYDFASVLINDSPIDTYALCVSAETQGWAFKTLDLSAYVSQTVTLAFKVTTDATVTSHLFIDDVGFQPGP
jgi:photosystem II stability/assembly factor-like uncharacterized protein